MIEISFVVSVYNAEKTLNKCLKSLLRQKFSNYEVLIVDDCSTDESTKIIQWYKQKYKNVRVIYNTENQGLGSVRYIGLHESLGQYVVYVDADDDVRDDYSYLLHKKISKNEYDIVYVLYGQESKNKSKMYTYELPYIDGSITDEDRDKLFMNQAIGKLSGFAFRRQFFIELKYCFIEHQNYDEDFISFFYPYCINKIGIINELLYYWRYEEDSMSRNPVDAYIEHYKDRLKNSVCMYHQAKLLGIFEKYPEQIEAIVVIALYINTLELIVGGREYVNLPQNILNRCRRIINKYIPNYKSNRYLKRYLVSKHEEWLLDLAKANDISFEAFKEEFYAKYRDCYMNKQDKIQKLLDELYNKKINVAIWGAGLKGKTFLYYMDKEGKYIQYVIDGDKALRGREIDEYHKIYTYEDVIDLVDVILIMNTRHYNSIQEKVNTEIKIIDMDQYIDSENEVKNII